jgi:hypothetical protein
MTVPNAAPLAALLASHPAEVADALAWLVERSHVRGVWHSAAEEQGLTASFDALCGAEIALRGGSFYWLAEHIDGRAIARMGAAAWLAQRCPPAPSSPSFDDREQASRDRLCDIHAMAVHYKHPTARAIRSILIGAGNGVPVGRDKYRGLLVRIGAYGVPLDVDAEVAAVWGEQAK